MEFDIVPQAVIVFSMAIIILILGRNISKVKETPDDFLFENRDEKKEKEKFLYLCKRLTRRINKEKYQEKVDSFWVWFEKVLRKLRIKFLRLDNKIVSALDKVKEKNVENEVEIEESKNDDEKLKSENMYVDNKIAEEKDENKLDTENKKGREKEYIDLIMKNPVDIKSYWKLGIVYSRRKNYKDAISCFRQITKIDPTYTKAKKKIIDLMGRMKKK
ncbi:MAG: hypothetical protein KAQ87_01535 [Candidatus Pacebacteria bacterium]|nr:hypothetical protein [Candidatus Paceibacterota bacterium]